MKARWLQPAGWKGVLRFLLYCAAAVAFVATLNLTHLFLGHAIYLMLSDIVLLTLLLYAVLSPRRTTANHQDWREVDNRRTARTWRAIRRLRSRDAAPTRKEPSSDRRP